MICGQNQLYFGTALLGCGVLIVAATADPLKQMRVELTRYSHLNHLCWSFSKGKHVTEPGEQPRHSGQDLCSPAQKPIVFSVTHENDRNNHLGSANYDPRITSYMHDFDERKDFGTWFGFNLYKDGKANILEEQLNTVDFDTINVTGWRLRFGHLFFAFNDLTVSHPLVDRIFVEFDIKLVHRRYGQIWSLAGIPGTE